MSRAPILVLALIALCACAPLRSTGAEHGVEWQCDPDANGMAATILDWARGIVSGTTKEAAELKQSYGFSDVLVDSVRVVTTQADCARAGRAYLEGERPRQGRHRVALVRVGDRYIAVDLDQLGRAGEFMTEAILDRRFKVLSWIMT
ncbi:MAG TPA: hypothetical protein VGP84_15710 [Gemmatimonadaceae bacterium]|jgi:hypothetical protein|nr:hypothetical protein [Gemmatimonadaceae bacterium]